MTEISAKIIADSVNPAGDRITTFELVYPRFIHSELMTHRQFSRNAASSRAIPIEKQIDMVLNDPAGPIRWGKNGKGMQDHGEMNATESEAAKEMWRKSAEWAVVEAKKLMFLGLHKQIVNRVLEPFVWMTTLVTATDYENFFSLRVHKDAQPEFQRLAYLMLKTYLGNGYPHTPLLGWGEWHTPYRAGECAGRDDKACVCSTARCARVSYTNHGKDTTFDEDKTLHDRLAASGHWSPFEHCAQATPGRHANLLGWMPYRNFFPNQNRKCDLQKLLANYEAGMDDPG